MRLAGILMLLFFTGKLSAQQHVIAVFDDDTKLPVISATVRAKSTLTFTNVSGTVSLNLNNISIGDTIKITHIGYRLRQFIIGKAKLPSKIYLQPDSLILSSVFIKGRRAKNQDSLNLRNEFAKTFAYKPIGLGDIFVKRSPYVTGTRPNNTSELATINLLQVFRLFGRNKDKTTKLQQTLIRDEEDVYISRTFSKEKVKSITHLSDDSVRIFMIRYRPEKAKAGKMNDYDVLQYIRKCYADFKKV
jgi:hypothetical protein